MSDDVTSRLWCVTPPAGEPVSLSEAKLFLRVDTDDEDDVVTRAISAARQACEQFLSAALLPQTWSYAVGQAGGCRVALPFGPVTSVTGVVVTDHAGNNTTLDSGSYRIGVDGFSIFFEPVPPGDVLTVTYAASMAATADDLPVLLVQGVLHHIAALYEGRDGSAPMPAASVQCYQPFRRVRL